MKEPINWKKVHDDIEEVLGDDFWDEMKDVIPKRGPTIDVYCNGERVVIFAEFPGIEVENHVKLKKEGQSIILHGEIPYRYPFPKAELELSERFTGTFQRKVLIPFPFSLQKIATFQNHGLVEIHILKG
ncbi:Hsp20/alpha crystallin family protein [Anaerobacillus alkaliphilus]|uniref:Hsp20/alpha crystallin family protein n=1 Tax=Anaerobacillus alkaliphilus TaxID=1548597 RepID=A0A4Q0VX54_9BACI|nr:Hsp20/alpha crystallin family protein [Anaerobacillus alkaliphilus]RXJ04327.1 Hsp20/alpha crystallin family protein [Anaerobacillus alkaliphilus]